jgi:hypothetical protein
MLKSQLGAGSRLPDRGTVCITVKNGDKARIKAALAADPVPGLAKVMDIKKLKKNFSRFDDKRTLAGAYDLFLADDRILSYLPQALGSKFFVKKKQPIAVRVSRKEVSNSIRAVYNRTQMTVSTGVCSNVKVAHMGQSVEEMVENITAASQNCAQRIPKGWNGIQSISIKTSESVALPIFNALATLAKLPPMAKKATTLAKRKLDEVDTTTEAEEAAPKSAKKAKKEVTAAPAKKESAKKESAPVKKTVAAKKEAAAPKAAAKKTEKKTPAPVKETTTATEKPSKKRKSEDAIAKTAKAPAAASAPAKKTAKTASTPPKQTKSTPPKKKTPPSKKK